MFRQVHQFCWQIYFLFKSYKKLGFRLFDAIRFTSLFFSKKLSVQEYLNYKPFLKDASFRDSFLSYNEAEKYWSLLNPNKYSAIARDKYLAHLVLEKAKIPMPKLYAYYNPETDDDYNSIRERLFQQGVRQCVVKPAADSAHGSGVFICKSIQYEDQDCIIEKSSGELLSLKHLIATNRYTPLLFEERVIQTQQLNDINPSSVNTVRFLTALYPNKQVKVIASFMKIGRLGSDVDNAGCGGNVDCALDYEKGICYNTIQFNSFEDIVRISRHPDTNALIEGLTIENWQMIVAKVEDFQTKVPYLKMIGWDIALTNEGPVVIEINNWWDTTGQLFIGKGWRNQVLDCYGAWKEHYKRNE